VEQGLDLFGRIGAFHACENDRGTPGTGHVEWKEVASTLREINYRGPIVIEAFTTEITEIARAVSLWRPLAPSQDSLAQEGLNFLRKIFAPD
jgi:D-psicose/D-tagatose/L-ribulose 3-epimerase